MNKKYFLAVAASTLMFAACGDDVTEVTEIHQDGMAVLEKGEKLSKQVCDTTNVGEMLFVMDSSEAFICDGESWQTLKGEKGENGEKGDSGADGDNGTSCSAKSVKNKAGLEGLEVTCGNTVVDTIWNGKDGTSGKDGVNGDGCTAKDDGKGKVTLTCGEGDDAASTILYKALCGTEPYDPAKSFCLEGNLYELCGGKSYNPAKSFCSDDKVYELCNKEQYNPKKQYCLETGEGAGKKYQIGTLFEDPRDKNVYKTVKICNDDESSCQTWMGENLNYDPGDVSSMSSYAWSGCFNDKEDACAKYGRLYTWEVAMDNAACAYGKKCDAALNPSTPVQGVCPEGWHLPSHGEFETLLNYIDPTFKLGNTDDASSLTAGKFLKSKTDWISGSGTDAYGFTALPAGYRSNESVFENVRFYTGLWSSGEYDKSDAFNLYLYSTSETVDLRSNDKRNAMSVRCIKD